LIYQFFKTIGDALRLYRLREQLGKKSFVTLAVTNRSSAPRGQFSAGPSPLPTSVKVDRASFLVRRLRSSASAKGRATWVTRTDPVRSGTPKQTPASPPAATSRSIPSLAFTLEHGGALALLSRPAKLLLPGAMNPNDLRFADPSSYHDRRRYANPNSSSSDLI